MLFVPVVESLDGWRVLGGSRSSGGRCDGGSLRLSRRSDVSSNVVSHRGSWRFEKRRGGAAYTHVFERGVSRALRVKGEGREGERWTYVETPRSSSREVAASRRLMIVVRLWRPV